jgi:chitinase
MHSQGLEPMEVFMWVHRVDAGYLLTNIKLLDEYADLQKPVDGVQGCLGSFAAIKQRMPHLKVILSIGGGSGSQHFAAVAANAALRDNFGRSARALVNSSGLDGIDSTFPNSKSCEQLT